MLSLFDSIKSLIRSLKASEHFSTITLFTKGNASANDLGENEFLSANLKIFIVGLRSSCMADIAYEAHAKYLGICIIIYVYCASQH